jgi:benzodiazapine receptor
MKTTSLLLLIIAFLLCFSAAAVGSAATTPAITGWYANLVKPSFSPPNWLFGPVWTALYIFMAIALWRVWESKKKKNAKEKRRAVTYFYIQLVLNVLWSILFFALQSPALAFIEILVLWAAIYVTIKKFFKVSALAGWLLVPYILWVSFAAVLNFAVMLLNSFSR